MGSSAFVFPGQGSQYVGMARDFYDGDADSRAFIEHADQTLGFALSRICFEGPEEELRQTRNTQPAIFLHSLVIARRLREPKPAMVAGHSLGEYSALVVAGAIEFSDALRLVRLRGELMQRAGETHKGTMAAVVGLDPDTVEEICTEASAVGIVQPANFNSPGQIVISGTAAGVQAAMAKAKEHGAKLVKELVVSGAFHSALMEDAREGLRIALEKTPLRNATIPVYANVTGEPVTKQDEIRDLLCRQLTNPVRWDQSIRNMVRDGAESFYEIGPGKVLQGLIKRITAATTTGGFEKLTETLREIDSE